MRLLQLWLNLPKKDRWATPRVQDLPLKNVPTLSEDGVHIKLYSGAFAGLQSLVQNYVPIIVADITMEAGTSTIQQVPANYNTFLYVIEGSVKIGDDIKQLKQDQVGWLDLSSDNVESDLHLTGGEEGVRFVLYAGKPTSENIVSKGPFIADSADDINRLYKEYRHGKMQHISKVADNQRITL